MLMHFHRTARADSKGMALNLVCGKEMDRLKEVESFFKESHRKSFAHDFIWHDIATVTLFSRGSCKFQIRHGGGLVSKIPIRCE